MGFLTGKLTPQTTFDAKADLRSGFDRFTPEALAANWPIVEFLRQFGAKRGATPAQLSLAWLLAQKPFIVPIPGTRSPDHLSENLAAGNVQLTSADLRELDSGFAQFKVTGGRMNADQMKIVE